MARKHITLPEEFEQYIIQREEISSTDYGNLVAICHPFKVITKETVVIIGMLEKEILWKRNKIQIVLIISIGYKEDEKIQLFYKEIVKSFIDKNKVQNMLSCTEFREFIQCV